MFRRTLSVLLVLCAATATHAKDEPQQANYLSSVIPGARLKRVVPPPGPRETFDILLDVDMPSPGWKLKLTSVAKPDDAGRIVIKLDGTRLPGMWPQSLTAMPARCTLGPLKVGTYIVDVYVRNPPHEYKRSGVFLLEAGRGG